MSLRLITCTTSPFALACLDSSAMAWDGHRWQDDVGIQLPASAFHYRAAGSTSGCFPGTGSLPAFWPGRRSQSSCRNQPEVPVGSGHSSSRPSRQPDPPDSPDCGCSFAERDPDAARPPCQVGTASSQGAVPTAVLHPPSFGICDCSNHLLQ